MNEREPKAFSVAVARSLARFCDALPAFANGARRSCFEKCLLHHKLRARLLSSFLIPVGKVVLVGF